MNMSGQRFSPPFTAARWGMALILMTQAQVCSVHAADKYTAPRLRMVEDHIAAEGVTDQRVLEQMRTVPRHEFVRTELRNFAYYDQALDIGYRQTISPPFIVAYMTEILEPQPTDRVLEIGTGSGYQAAVLSGLVQDVYTIEIVEPLGRRAAALLDRLGYQNVHCRVGDGYQGWAEHAPFDKIIVTCSPEDIPKPLVQQLKEGGKMIIPLGERYQQVFYLLEKKDGELQQKKLIPTLFVPMTGRMEEMRAKKPDPLRPQISNGGFEVDDNEDGLADGWHYQRRSTLVDDGVEGLKSICFENHEAGRSAHVLQGLPIDGSKIPEISLSWAMKSAGIREGRTPQEVPGIIIYIFNEKRLPIERITIGPWLIDETEWTRHKEVIRIPAAGRELILQAGMNGATGRLWLDDFRVQPTR